MGRIVRHAAAGGSPARGTSVLVALAVVATSSGGAVVSADPTAVEIAVAADVPFTAEDLSAALTLRTGDDATSADGRAAMRRIAVTAGAEAGVVVVVVDGARRVVDLGGLSGTAAARRVAVVSLDLFRPLPPPTPPAPLAIEVPVTAETMPPLASPTAGLAVAAPASRSIRGPRFAIRLAGAQSTAGRGGGVELLVTGLLPRALRLISFDGLSIGAEITQADGADGLRVTEVPLAVGLGGRLHLGRVAFSNGVRMVVERNHIGVDDGTSRVGHTTWRLGEELSLGLGLRLFGPVFADLSGRVRGYFSRQRYQVGGIDVYSTHWVNASIGVGLTVALGQVRW